MSNITSGGGGQSVTDQPFLLRWLWTSTIGGMLALAIGAEAPPFFAGFLVTGDPANEAGYQTAWAVVLAGVLGGALLGIAQWPMLRRRFRLPFALGRRWVLASGLGFALSFIVIWLLGGSDNSAVYAHHALPHAIDRIGLPGGLLIGAAVGAAQWLVLRAYVTHFGWWLLANIGGFAAGWLGAALVPFSGPEAHFVGGVAFGLLFGLVTGAVLRWLIPAAAPGSI